jgi:predicted O-methyltransferase YrrM
MTIEGLRDKALSEHIPIILPETVDYLVNFIKENNIKKILEVGSAVGYSAIIFGLSGCSVLTMEKNINLFNQALINIKEFNLEDKIKVLNVDAKTYTLSPDYQFDLLFIDASKANYKYFFDNFNCNLKPFGWVICDNMGFHNVDINNTSKNVFRMLTKLNEFSLYMKNLDTYKTSIVDVGDKLLVGVKL